MTKYNFYEFNGMTNNFNTPEEAVKSFKNTVRQGLNRYVALGVERETFTDRGCVDLIVFKDGKIQISKDINHSDMKDDSLITINTMKIFKEALNL